MKRSIGKATKSKARAAHGFTCQCQAPSVVKVVKEGAPNQKRRAFVAVVPHTDGKALLRP